MAVYVRISPDQVKVKIDDAWKSTLEILSEEILNDCNEYCKEDIGTLKASAMIHSDLLNGRLIWQTPYARRQYYEIKTAYKDVNPKATWKWCEVAKAKHQEEWAKKAQRLMRMMQS